MPIVTRRPAGWIALFLALAGAAPQAQPILDRPGLHQPVFAPHGMVASQEARATAIGVAVLRDGGTAVDAAVAVGFALAVTLPRAGNLGGGGFMLVHRADPGDTQAIDYRETAPAAASSEMFLDAAGMVDVERARHSHRAVGVPGTVAGLVLAQRRYGTRPLPELLAPAIRLAEEGIVVDPDLAATLAARRDRFARWPASAAVFLKPDGATYAPGELLRQPDLAWSLREIAAGGASAFYRGAVAARIVADMTAHGGLIAATDLAGYEAVVRPPVAGDYRGHRVVAMPPPSSGGVHLIQMLNVLEGWPLGALGHNGADGVHLLAETMKLAFADRARHLGDPDFWPVPVSGLLSPDYADVLRRRVDPARATPAAAIRPGQPPADDGDQTTHFSILDRYGNAVVNTYTLNFSYGTGIVAAGTGILLNNQMDDFSAKPGVPNAYGLVGGEANAIAPGKRPLSSMTPTLVFRDGRVILATGSPGGPRIISAVLQVLVNVIDHGMNVADAVAAPRVHHQWLPDQLAVEPGLSPDTLAALAGRGHDLRPGRAFGGAHSIMRVTDGLHGAADPRQAGALAAGH